MKPLINRLLPVFFAGMFIHAGCAKQSFVKQDEKLAPSAAAVTTSGSATVAPNAKPAMTAAPANIKELPLTTGEAKQSRSVAAEPAATADLAGSLEKIYFDFDSSLLDDAARQSLSRNFAVLKKNRQLRVRIEGNCDERGSDEYNLALGERRAKAAVNYLTALGVKADRLAYISFGKEKPAVPGHDEAAMARNRRDDFVVTSR